MSILLSQSYPSPHSWHYSWWLNNLGEQWPIQYFAFWDPWPLTIFDPYAIWPTIPCLCPELCHQHSLISIHSLYHLPLYIYIPLIFSLSSLFYLIPRVTIIITALGILLFFLPFSFHQIRLARAYSRLNPHPCSLWLHWDTQSCGRKFRGAGGSPWTHTLK